MSNADHDNPHDRTGEPGYWREANALMRCEREQSKAQDRRARKGIGQLASLAKAAIQRHAGNPHAQINFVLRRAMIVAATGRNRVVSDKRKSDLGDVFHQCLRELKPLGVNLQNITEFSQKHFIALVRSWEARQISESTIQERICLLRRILSLIGKPNVIPVGPTLRTLLAQHQIQAGRQGRSYIPDLPKGWRDQGIDVAAVLRRVGCMDFQAYLLLLAMLHFGLRFNEAIQLQPARSRHGDHLFVWRGTKGGKPRSIPFSADPEKALQQNRVLDQLVHFASSHPKGELGWSELTLEQGKIRMRGFLRAAGITKRDLGITAHGLRHQYATDLFQELTGLPAPVLRQLPYSVYAEQKEKVAAAFLEISRRMGHERPRVTQVYGGSVHRLRNDDGKGSADGSEPSM